jgi:hypothetical protein
MIASSRRTSSGSNGRLKVPPTRTRCRCRCPLRAFRLPSVAEDRLRPPDTGDLRDDALTLLRAINCDLASPTARILRGLLAGVADDPELLTQLHELATDGGAGAWLTVLRHAVARSEVSPESLHPRVALVLLRNEYLTRGLTTVDDAVLVEIVDEVYLPLVRGRAGTVES